MHMCISWLCPFKSFKIFAPGAHLCTRIWVRLTIGLLKKAIVNLPIRLKGNSKRTSGNSLSPLGAQNKDIDAVVTSRGYIPREGGVRLRILGGGVPPGPPNPDPISDQKRSFFHTRFHTWPLKSTPILRPGL